VDQEEDLYQEHFPTFTDAEVEAAVQAPGPVVSVAGRVGVPHVFVLALATQAGRIGPLVLTGVAAVELRKLLQTLGF
jgi:hypothetical protein